MRTTKPITERNILESMNNESMWDTLLEDFTMPTDLYDNIKDLQAQWQAWLDEKAIELDIPKEKIKECRQY